MLQRQPELAMLRYVLSMETIETQPHPSRQDLACLQQIVADQAFTNAKLNNDIEVRFQRFVGRVL